VTASQRLGEEEEEERTFKGYSFHPRVGNRAQEIRGLCALMSHVSTANYGHACSRGSSISLLFILEKSPSDSSTSIS